MERHHNAAVLLRARAAQAAAFLSEAEVRDLAEQLERLLQIEFCPLPTRATHYSVGDYLKYDPDP
jgi:hypothetical protein